MREKNRVKIVFEWVNALKLSVVLTHKKSRLQCRSISTKQMSGKYLSRYTGSGKV